MNTFTVKNNFFFPMFLAFNNISILQIKNFSAKSDLEMGFLRESKKSDYDIYGEYLFYYILDELKVLINITGSIKLKDLKFGLTALGYFLEKNEKNNNNYKIDTFNILSRFNNESKSPYMKSISSVSKLIEKISLLHIAVVREYRDEKWNYYNASKALFEINQLLKNKTNIENLNSLFDNFLSISELGDLIYPDNSRSYQREYGVFKIGDNNVYYLDENHETLYFIISLFERMGSNDWCVRLLSYMIHNRGSRKAWCLIDGDEINPEKSSGYERMLNKDIERELKGLKGKIESNIKNDVEFNMEDFIVKEAIEALKHINFSKKHTTESKQIVKNNIIRIIRDTKKEI